MLPHTLSPHYGQLKKHPGAQEKNAMLTGALSCHCGSQSYMCKVSIMRSGSYTHVGTHQVTYILAS